MSERCSHDCDFSCQQSKKTEGACHRRHRRLYAPRVGPGAQ